MMRTRTHWTAGLAGLALAVTASPSFSQQSSSSAQSSSGDQPATRQARQANTQANLETQAQQTIQTFKQTDPTLEPFFRKSAGYAVFPNVGEGGFIVGGAHGKGIVYQNGQPIGETTVSKGSVGAQIGGQTYSELVFFENQQSLDQFKQGNFQFSAGVNAVAANAGVGAATNYRNGVAVFTASRTGLMAKAAIGGQKFTYQPLAMGGAGSSGQGGTSSGSSSKATPNGGSSH